MGSEDEKSPEPKKTKYLKEDGDREPTKSVPSWKDEFDDGLDDDYRGDAADRRMLDSMTEKEREEEIFKRAEKREELKKRFEISQKLKRQTSAPSVKDRSEGELSSGDEVSNHPEQLREDRQQGYEVKHAAKFSALSQLKAKREEKEKKEKERRDKEDRSKKSKRGANSGSDSDLEKLAKSGNKKMRASEIYSSSSNSGNENERRRSSSSSSSSSS